MLKDAVTVALVTMFSCLFMAFALFALAANATIEVQTLTTKTYRVIPPWSHPSPTPASPPKS